MDAMVAESLAAPAGQASGAYAGAGGPGGGSRVFLVGDAAHQFPPSGGFGLCVCLSVCLRQGACMRGKGRRARKEGEGRVDGAEDAGPEPCYLNPRLSGGLSASCVLGGGVREGERGGGKDMARTCNTHATHMPRARKAHARYMLSCTPRPDEGWCGCGCGCGVVWCGVVWCGMSWCGADMCGTLHALRSQQRPH